MTLEEIRKRRLINQKLAVSELTNAEDLVGYSCGMQAQDYTSSKWAIGSRIQGLTDQKIEQAIANRKIVRSWLMRGTLHVTATKDIRWILDLLAPRLIKAGAGRNRQLELDEKILAKSNKIIERSLQGGANLRRNELGEILEKEGISITGQRLYHILQHAALKKLICFGARRNKEFTFVLLDDYIPQCKAKTHDEATAEMVRRYFQSRGPATLQDFIWWSGLKITDARNGLETVKNEFTKELIHGLEYFSPSSMPTIKPDVNQAFLLPAFDEYVIAYRDRSALLDPLLSKDVISKNGIFYPTIVKNGKVIGTWKRQFKNNHVSIELSPFQPLSKATKSQIMKASKSFGVFAEKEVIFR